MSADPLEMDAEEYARFVDQQISEADRQAVAFLQALATNQFDQWWEEYVTGIKKELEDIHVRFEPATAGGDSEASE